MCCLLVCTKLQIHKATGYSRYCNATLKSTTTPIIYYNDLSIIVPSYKVISIIKVIYFNFYFQWLDGFLWKTSRHCWYLGRSLMITCKQSLMLLNFSLVLNSSAKILTSGLALQIHLTILASFLFCLIKSSSEREHTLSM